MGLRTFGIVQLGLLVTGAALAATNARSLDVTGVAYAPITDDEPERIAKEFLDRVDWTSPNLVVWMPGINAGPGVRGDFREALRDVASKHWIGALEYPRGADMRRNVPIGARALELVLEEIGRRDPDGSRYRVSVGGESLGAWMTSEVLSRDAARVIDKAVYFGVSGPAPAIPKEFASRVRVLRNVWDPAAMPYIGSGELWTDAGDLAFGGGSSRIPGALLHALLNPYQSIVGAVSSIPVVMGGEAGFRNHPHNYWREMPSAARYMIDE